MRARFRAHGRLGRYLVCGSGSDAQRRDHLSHARPEWRLLYLARKPNYDFEKRRKELDRKAKKDAKREERLQRKQENADNGVEGADPDLEGIVPGPQNINDIMDQK